MKSVGEAMAIGRTFQESFQKAMRSLETGLDGWSLPRGYKRLPHDKLIYNMRVPNPERMVAIKQALEDGETLDDIFEYTKIDPWFLAQVCRAWGGWGPELNGQTFLPSHTHPASWLPRSWASCTRLRPG